MTVAFVICASCEFATQIQKDGRDVKVVSIVAYSDRKIRWGVDICSVSSHSVAVALECLCYDDLSVFAKGPSS